MVMLIYIDSLGKVYMIDVIVMMMFLKVKIMVVVD